MDVGMKRSRDEVLTEEVGQKRPKLDACSSEKSKPQKKTFLLQKLKQLAGRVDNMLSTTNSVPNNDLIVDETITQKNTTIHKQPKTVTTGAPHKARPGRKPSVGGRGPGRPPTTTTTTTPITTVTEGRPKRLSKTPLKVSEDTDDVTTEPKSTRGRKPEPWHTQCSKILHTLMVNKWAWPFVEPVNPEELGIPDYFIIIKNPMDLGTIRKSLDAKKYSTPEEFANDIRLVWNNCYLYNKPDSDIVKMAHQLSAIFEKRFPKILESSSAERRAQREHERKIREMQKEIDKKIEQPPKLARTNSKKSVTKDEPEDDRPMTYDEKRTLSLNMKKLPPEKLGGVVDIIRARQAQTANQSNDEIEIDLDQLDNITLRQLSKFVRTSLTANKKRRTSAAKKPSSQQESSVVTPTEAGAAQEKSDSTPEAHNAPSAMEYTTDVHPREDQSFIASPQSQASRSTSEAQPQTTAATQQQQQEESDTSSESDMDSDSDSESSQSDTDKITFDPSGPIPLTSEPTMYSSATSQSGNGNRHSPRVNSADVQSVPNNAQQDINTVMASSAENNGFEDVNMDEPKIISASVDDQEELTIENVDCWSNLVQSYSSNEENSNNSSLTNLNGASATTSSDTTSNPTDLPALNDSNDDLWHKYKAINEQQRQREREVEELERQQRLKREEQERCRREAQEAEKRAEEERIRLEREKADQEAAEAKRRLEQARLQAKLQREQMTKTVNLDTDQALLQTMSNMQRSERNINAQRSAPANNNFPSIFSQTNLFGNALGSRLNNSTTAPNANTVNTQNMETTDPSK